MFKSTWLLETSTSGSFFMTMCLFGPLSWIFFKVEGTSAQSCERQIGGRGGRQSCMVQFILSLPLASAIYELGTGELVIRIFYILVSSFFKMVVILTSSVAMEIKGNVLYISSFNFWELPVLKPGPRQLIYNLWHQEFLKFPRYSQSAAKVETEFLINCLAQSPELLVNHI